MACVLLAELQNIWIYQQIYYLYQISTSYLVCIGHVDWFPQVCQKSRIQNSASPQGEPSQISFFLRYRIEDQQKSLAKTYKISGSPLLQIDAWTTWSLYNCGLWGGNLQPTVRQGPNIQVDIQSFYWSSFYPLPTTSNLHLPWSWPGSLWMAYMPLQSSSTGRSLLRSNCILWFHTLPWTPLPAGGIFYYLVFDQRVTSRQQTEK